MRCILCTVARHARIVNAASYKPGVLVQPKSARSWQIVFSGCPAIRLQRQLLKMDPPVTTKRCCTACRLSVMPADKASEATSDDGMSCKHCIYALAYGRVRRPQTDLVCILLADHIFGSTKRYGPPVAIAQLSSLADVTFKRRHPPSSTERNGAVAGFEFGRTAAGCDSSDPRRSCKPHVCHIGPFPPFAMRADSHSGLCALSGLDQTCQRRESLARRRAAVSRTSAQKTLRETAAHCGSGQLAVIAWTPAAASMHGRMLILHGARR